VMPSNSTDLTCVRTPAGLRQAISDWRGQGLRVAFVPTMGALHEGHLSLVRLGLTHADRVVASIFVNPTQFAPHEDFGAYPRTETRDLELLASAGCTLAYCPSPADIYPDGDSTTVAVSGVSQPLEGAFRPHFFGGVATVVARLFVHVAPDVALFGEKDFQQLQVIRRMTRDLGFAIEIIGGQTLREPDGLAMSSRNAYLTASERQTALTLYTSLKLAKERIQAGEPVGPALAEARAGLAAAGFAPVDYVAACDAATLNAYPDDSPGPTGRAGRILGAATLGRTRLIDNLSLDL